MNNIKKATAIVLTLGILSSAPAVVLADEQLTAVPIRAELGIEATGSESQEVHPLYYSFTGTVKEINKGSNGLITVFVEDKDGSPANFVLSDATYYADGAKIEAGAELTGFYRSDRPMILIYPPQYPVEIVAPVTEGQSIKADMFDANLLSLDKSLKLNISEETEILWENGTQINWIAKPTAEDLAAVISNRKLLVFYNFTTKSIPAQTTPTKVVVLSEKADDTAAEHKLMVNGEAVNSSPLYMNDEGVLMLPVRAAAEALGFKVSWNGAARSVVVGNASFTLGRNEYAVSKSVSVSLETHSELKDGKTYVPLSFFKDVLNIENVSYEYGEVHLDAAK